VIKAVKLFAMQSFMPLTNNTLIPVQREARPRKKRTERLRRKSFKREVEEIEAVEEAPGE